MEHVVLEGKKFFLHRTEAEIRMAAVTLMTLEEEGWIDLPMMLSMLPDEGIKILEKNPKIKKYMESCKFDDPDIIEVIDEISLVSMGEDYDDLLYCDTGAECISILCMESQETYDEFEKQIVKYMNEKLEEDDEFGFIHEAIFDDCYGPEEGFIVSDNKIVYKE